MALPKRPKKILRKSFFLFVLGLPVSASSTGANDFPDSTLSEIQHIINLTVTQSYDDARAVSQKLQTRFPEHPAGYFFEAAAIYSRMLDFEIYDKKDEFFALTAKVKKLCRAELKKKPENSWLYFFLGSALGYEAYFNGKAQKLLQAFREGLDSIKMLQRALALDSTNYDIYLGIGTYKYYKSKFSRYLAWMPFVEDEREAGVSMIKTAIEKGRFSRAPAQNSLIWILIDLKRYDEAIKVANQALDGYPDSRFFLWAKAAAAFEMGDLQGAKVAYQRILRTYAEERKRSYLNELICHARLAEIYFEEGASNPAKKHAEKALAIEIPKSLKTRAREYRKKARKVLKNSS